MVVNWSKKALEDIQKIEHSDVAGAKRVVISDGHNIDAFGRVRVSTPFTVFDSKNIYNDPDLGTNVENMPLFFDNQETSGTGTSTTYKPNESSQSLSVSANTAGTRVRQTFRRFNYQPGKSQLHFNSFVMGPIKSGITKREGYFDDNNGFFLEVSDDIYIVKRSFTTGSAVDTKTAQSDWNIDKLDGTGDSGITLDITKIQIFALDFEWLGSGRVRYGFVMDGQIIYCHEDLNANVLDKVYSATPNLPVRTEITNDGTGEADTITQVCSTVISEGGQEETGVVRYVSTGGTHLDAATENTLYCLMALRLKTPYIGSTVKQIKTDLQIQTASHKLEWVLIFNPTIAGTLSFTGLPQSAIEYALGVTANTVTGGYAITGGFLESGGVSVGAGGSTKEQLQNALVLGSKIDGTRDIIVLAVRPIAGSTNIDVEGAMTWRELN